MKAVKYLLIIAVLAVASIFVTGGGGCQVQCKVGDSKVMGAQFQAGVQNISPVKGILQADPRA